MSNVYLQSSRSNEILLEFIGMYPSGAVLWMHKNEKSENVVQRLGDSGINPRVADHWHELSACLRLIIRIGIVKMVEMPSDM